MERFFSHPQALAEKWITDLFLGKAFGLYFLCRLHVAGSVAQKYSNQQSSTSNAERESYKQCFAQYPIYEISSSATSLL